MPLQKQSSNTSSIESLQKRNWTPWFILVVVVFVLGVWSIFAVRSENQHRNIAKLYAEAFMLYQKIDLSKPYESRQDINIKNAITSLTSVANFSGKFTEKYIALTQIALLYIHQKKPEDAISFLEQVRKAPKHFVAKVQAMTLLARIYEEEQKPEWAVKIYEELESQAQGEALDFVRYQLGVLYSSNKDTVNQAINMYNKIQKDSSLKVLAERNIFMLNALSEKTIKKV